MTAAGDQILELGAAEYLESLHSMTRELERAMQAIAANDISGFEESIDSQQVLSARLAKLADDLCIPLQCQPALSRPSMDEAMLHQIRSADQTLQILNRRYAALLQHSSRSIALMASLFRSFQGQIQEVSGPRLKQQTWSCQM